MALPRMRRNQRGFGLFDSLIALSMLGFGMLALTQFQSRLVAQSTEAQNRLLATQISEELLNMALIDPDNATCYTVPAVGACGSAPALAYTNAWSLSAAGRLRGNDKVEAALNAVTNQLRVTLTWASKNPSEPVHELQVVADVRP
jgi:type IV pilus assembly protein PilV